MSEFFQFGTFSIIFFITCGIKYIALTREHM